MQDKPRFQELREKFYEEKGDFMNDLRKVELAKQMGISVEVVKKAEYEAAKENKGYKRATLKAYCDFFHVSADYLLGFDDVKTKDVNIKMIAKYTGLTEDSIERLHNMKNVYGVQYDRWISTLNAILKDDQIIYLLSDIIYPPSNAEAVIQRKSEDDTYPVEPIFDKNGKGTLILNPDSPNDNHPQKITFRLLEVSIWEEIKQHINQLKPKRKDGDINGKESSVPGKRNGQRDKVKRSKT